MNGLPVLARHAVISGGNRHAQGVFVPVCHCLLTLATAMMTGKYHAMFWTITILDNRNRGMYPPYEVIPEPPFTYLYCTEESSGLHISNLIRVETKGLHDFIVVSPQCTTCPAVLRGAMG